MIRIDFNPDKIPGSLLLLLGDLKDPSALAVKLRDATNPLSNYLQGQLSPQTQLLLNSYDVSVPPPVPLQSALVEGLNQQLSDSNLFSREHFKGIDLERDTLIKALVQQAPQGEELLRLNRLLLEDAYLKEIVKSPKAEWDAWNSLAQKAKENVIQQWENWKKAPGSPSAKFKPKWEEYIWKGIRDWLLKYTFHNKCAYCETPGVGYIPDAEHFRPKGQVRTKSGIVKTFDVDGTEITHPGYFWLAYHWQNLLPSCNTCNRYGGKKDVFPAKEHVAVKRIHDSNEINKLRHQITRSTTDNYIFYLEPEDLDIFENRLLIHPYLDRPEADIYFELDGMATPRNRSERGAASIEVYSLNEPSKVAARHQAQDDDVERYVTRVLAVRSDPIKMKMTAREIRDQYYKGGRPYGAAVFDYIRHYVGKTPLDPEVLLKESPQEDAEASK